MTTTGLTWKTYRTPSGSMIERIAPSGSGYSYRITPTGYTKRWSPKYRLTLQGEAISMCFTIAEAEAAAARHHEEGRDDH